MTTTDQTWTAADLTAAEEAARLAREEVDRLRAVLATEDTARNEIGQGTAPTAAEIGQAEARRRHPRKVSAVSTTGVHDNATGGDAGPEGNGTTVADGVAEARRRAGLR
jgi:hypothetical protein